MKRKWKVSGLLCLLAFAAALLLTAAVTLRTSLHLLDSDASGELVLAEHLHAAGRVLSQEWTYSTELRVINTQLVFAPLFALLDSWRRVRFVGAMLLQGVLLAGYGYMTKHARLGRRAFLLGGALLLLPTSVAYGRIVLYHSYYVPHLAIGFFTVGLLLASLRDENRIWRWMHTALYLLLCFGGALGGLRQPAITQGPVMLAALWLWWRKRGTLRLPLLAAAGCACAVAGLAVHGAWGDVYHFEAGAGVGIQLLSANELGDVAYAFLNLLGLRRGADGLLWRVLGRLSVPALALCACMCLPVKQRDEADGCAFIRLLAPFGAAVYLTIVLFTSQDMLAPRYLLPFVIWIIPTACMALDRTGARRAAAWVLCAVLAVNGVCNAAWFLRPDDSQPYEGLEWNHPDTVQALSPLRDWLMSRGYTLGYTTFWSGNILTEMTNGTIDMISIYPGGEGFVYHDWLTLPALRSAQVDRPFVLLPDHIPDPTGLLVPVHSSGGFTIYDIPDPAAWRNMLNAAPALRRTDQ